LPQKHRKTTASRITDSIRNRLRSFTVNKIKTTIRVAAIKTGQIISKAVSRRKTEKPSYAPKEKKRRKLRYLKAGKAKFVADKEKNKKIIVRLYKADAVPDSKLFERKISGKVKNLPYRTQVMIDFEILNYYGVRKKGDLPVLERKQFYIHYRDLKNMSGVKQSLPHIIRQLRDSVDYRMDKNKFIKDAYGKPIPTNLQFVRIMKVVRWDSPYRPKELRKAKHAGKVKFKYASPISYEDWKKKAKKTHIYS
jgi:hypothetical protein